MSVIDTLNKAIAVAKGAPKTVAKVETNLTWLWVAVAFLLLRRK